MTESRGQARSVLDAAHLPDALVRFLNRGSYSLMIKGGPATGKTILALTLLKVLGVRRNYLYISTRVSPTQLFNNLPWLTEFLATEKAAYVQPVEEPRVPENFVDARLDEPTTFFERVTNELMDVEAPLIVIDTWDPIGEVMEMPALVTNIRVLQTWRERANARIIFLTEDPEDETLDHVVDGVVTLNKEYVHDRMVRTILLSKLQGVRTDRPSSIFTLSDGIFRSFEKYNPLRLAPKEAGRRRAPNAGRSEALPEWAPDGIANDDLAVVLEGRLPVGSIVDVEVTSRANAKAVVLLLDRLLTRQDGNERITLLVPSKEIDWNYLRTNLRTSGSMELFVLGQRKDAGREPQATSPAASPQVRDIRSEVLRLRKEYPKKSLSIVTGGEIMAAAGDQRTSGSLTDFLRNRVDLSILLGRTGGRMLHESGWMADVRLRVSDIKGTLVLEPEIPWGEFHAFVIGQKSGRPSLCLMSIV